MELILVLNYYLPWIQLTGNLCCDYQSCRKYFCLFFVQAISNSRISSDLIHTSVCVQLFSKQMFYLWNDSSDINRYPKYWKNHLSLLYQCFSWIGVLEVHGYYRLLKFLTFCTNIIFSTLKYFGKFFQYRSFKFSDFKMGSGNVL